MTLAGLSSTSLNLRQPMEDETSCGPLCQHPSCWASNTRRDKGFPHYTRMTQSIPEPLQTDLPAVTQYNILDDFGDQYKDPHPIKTDGRHWQYRLSDKSFDSSGALSVRKPLPSTPRKRSLSLEDKKSLLNVVEVQEVFDVQDLNTKWDETFITKQCYMWVPNPNRLCFKRSDAEYTQPSDKVDSKQHVVLVKDHTEEMMPQEIERHREESRIKKIGSQGSSMSRPRTFMKTPRPTPASDKPRRVDSDGLQDLLDLPRDVLMQVLEHLNESDFNSKDKVRSVIQQVTTDNLHNAKQSSSLTASAVMHQQKVKLLQCNTRNVRQPSILTQPVFQLDDDHPSSNDTRVKDTGSDIDTTHDGYSLQAFSKYKKALPGIGSTAYSEGANVPHYHSNKIPSVSLGLPELPSGVSQIRPFTYNNRQYFDLSIGPIPSPPLSTDHSSEFGGSDHGTTVRPIIASASTRLEREVCGIVYDPYYTRHSLSKSPKGLLKSPAPSPKLPKTPLSKSPLPISTIIKPAVISGPSRDISVSPVPRFQAPANSPNPSPPTTPVAEVVASVEVIDESKDLAGRTVRFDEEHLQPTQNATTDNTTKAVCGESSPRTNKATMDTNVIDSDQSQMKTVQPQMESSDVAVESSSPDAWPDVNESAYEQVSVTTSSEQQLETERASRSARSVHTPGSRNSSRNKANAGNRDSDHESRVRMLMDDNQKDQSPAPPPPSPELKGGKKLGVETIPEKSSSSLVMAPLYEENGEAVDPPISPQTANGLSIEQDPGATTQISHVAPVGSTHRGKEMSEQSFVNVDIPADQPVDVERINGDGACGSSVTDGTTFRSNIPSSAGISAAGYITEGTLTGEMASDECEDSSSDVVNETTPVIKNKDDDKTQGTLDDTSSDGQSRCVVLEDSGLQFVGESSTDTEKLNLEPLPCDVSKEPSDVCTGTEESDFIMVETDIILTSTDTLDTSGNNETEEDKELVDTDLSPSRTTSEPMISTESIAGKNSPDQNDAMKQVVTVEEKGSSIGHVDESDDAGDVKFSEQNISENASEVKDTEQTISDEAGEVKDTDQNISDDSVEVTDTKQNVSDDTVEVKDTDQNISDDADEVKDTHDQNISEDTDIVKDTDQSISEDTGEVKNTKRIISEDTGEVDNT